MNIQTGQTILSGAQPEIPNVPQEVPAQPEAPGITAIPEEQPAITHSPEVTPGQEPITPLTPQK